MMTRRPWRDVAEELLRGSGMGAQVSRVEAWRRACERIATLEAQLERYRRLHEEMP